MKILKINLCECLIMNYYQNETNKRAIEPDRGAFRNVNTAEGILPQPFILCFQLNNKEIPSEEYSIFILSVVSTISERMWFKQRNDCR